MFDFVVLLIWHEAAIAVLVWDFRGSSCFFEQLIWSRERENVIVHVEHMLSGTSVREVNGKHLLLLQQLLHGSRTNVRLAASWYRGTRWQWLAFVERHKLEAPIIITRDLFEQLEELELIFESRL